MNALSLRKFAADLDLIGLTATVFERDDGWLRLDTPMMAYFWNAEGEYDGWETSDALAHAMNLNATDTKAMAAAAGKVLKNIDVPGVHAQRLVDERLPKS